MYCIETLTVPLDVINYLNLTFILKNRVCKMEFDWLHLHENLCHKNVLSLIKISPEWSHHVWPDCIFSPYMCSCICLSINVIWLWENKQGRTHRESVQGLLVYLLQLSGLKNKCHANGAPAMSCQSSRLGIHGDLLNHLKRHALLNEKISAAKACV